MVDLITMKLHKDVMTYILLRVPLKSLIRFKCISKAWYSLLQSIFINLHLNRSTTTKDELILFKRSIKLEEDLYKNMLSFLYSNDDYTLNHVSPDIDVPHSTTDYCSNLYQLLGPCRGLIVSTDFEDIVLLNPATRKYRLLPRSPFICPKGFNYIVRGVGFGYDSIANYYKVVRIFEVFMDKYTRYRDTRYTKVEVYDLCINSWRDINLGVKMLPRVRRFPCCEILYKGAFHWCSNKGTPIILCFDIDTETFRKMKLPNIYYFWDNKGYGLTILKNSLTLICYPHPKGKIDQGQEFTNIWIMERYGVGDTWMNKYSIKPLPIESSLAIWKDHVLLFQSINGTLSSYDINSDEIKEFGFQGFPSSLRLLVYKESLTKIPTESEYGTEVQNF